MIPAWLMPSEGFVGDDVALDEGCNLVLCPSQCSRSFVSLRYAWATFLVTSAEKAAISSGYRVGSDTLGPDERDHTCDMRRGQESCSVRGSGYHEAGRTDATIALNTWRSPRQGIASDTRTL